MQTGGNPSTTDRDKESSPPKAEADTGSDVSDVETPFVAERPTADLPTAERPPCSYPRAPVPSPFLSAICISLTVGSITVVLFHSVPANTSSCDRTKIFPFDVGCPYDCSDLRPDLANASFYRISAAWEFGELATYRKNVSEIPMSAFHGASTAAKSFLQTEMKLRTSVLASVASSRLDPLHVTQQVRMHVSLSYLCCLTKAEVATAASVISKWNDSTTFSETVTFANLECLHERKDSVTVIWEVNKESERALMEWNQSLGSQLEEAGVRVWVSRTEQMPFHTTILGFTNPEEKDIAGYLTHIARSVSAANRVQASAHISFGVQTSPARLSRGCKRFE